MVREYRRHYCTVLFCIFAEESVSTCTYTDEGTLRPELSHAGVSLYSIYSDPIYNESIQYQDMTFAFEGIISKWTA